MNPQTYEERIQNVFDSYCKKILKAQIIDLYRKKRRQAKYEICFSEMSAQELAELSVTDKYFVDEYGF